jgi:hypothetical protein
MTREELIKRIQNKDFTDLGPAFESSDPWFNKLSEQMYIKMADRLLESGITDGKDILHILDMCYSAAINEYRTKYIEK